MSTMEDDSRVSTQFENTAADEDGYRPHDGVDTPSVAFTIVSPSNRGHGARCEATIRAAIDRFKSPSPRATAKGSLELFCPATFYGDHRTAASLEQAWALGFDVDEEPTPSAEEIAASLYKLGAWGWFHSSPSATSEAPRWHLFIVASRPITSATEYKRAHAAIRAKLGYRVGAAAKDASRLWTLPREPEEGDYVFREVAGEPIDVDALLETPDARPSFADAGGGFAPIPVNIDTPVGRACERVAIEHCKNATPSIQGQDGSGKLWDVSIHLLRRLELPLDRAHEIISEHFNPRCVPPWSAEEIQHKLEDARDSSEIGAWWPDDAHDAMWARFTEIRSERLARKLRDALARPRRMHDPAHVYTFTVGDVLGASHSNKPKRTHPYQIENALIARDEWTGVFQWDEFKRQIVAVDPPLRLDAERGGFTNSDARAVSSWFAVNCCFAISKEHVRDSVELVAKQRPFHPVREYLSKLSPSSGVLSTLARRVLGVDPVEQPLAETFLTKYLIAAVRRVLEPGCKVDTMLVLYGKQGKGKSTFCKELFGEWFRDQLPDITNRDGSHALEGYWGIEVPELHKFLRVGSEAVKEYLSRSRDTYRQYGNGDKVEADRQCVFIGTTNLPNFQRDETGGRRFWPIHVGEVDVAFVRANRDAIWSEALALALAGEPHWLSAEEERRADEMRQDYADEEPWHDLVADYLASKAYVVSATEVYQGLFFKAPPSRRDTDSIMKTMRRLGCRESKEYVNGARRKVFLVPEGLASLPPRVRVLAGAASVPHVPHVSPIHEGHAHQGKTSA